MLVRREAAEGVGWLDPGFFVYSDETDFCRRLHDAGWRILFVPAARAVHHDQLSTDLPRWREGSWSSTAAAIATSESTACPRPGSPGRSAGRGPTSSARRRRWPCRTRLAALPAARPPAADARPRRGLARGGRGVQRLARPLAGGCPSTLSAPMEHADLAQTAAVCGALGSALVLLARERLALLGGLLLLGLAEAGLVGSLGGGDLDKLSSAAGGAAALLGLVVLVAAAALLSRRPAWVPVAVLLAAPFRPPLDFSGSNRFFVSRRGGRAPGPPAAALLRPGRRGAGARLADPPRRRGPRAAASAGAARRRLPRLRLPVAAVGGRSRGRGEHAHVLHAAVRGAAGHGRPRRVPRLGPARAGHRAIALASVFAAVGVWQAITHELSSTRRTSPSRTRTRTTSA